jgi:drug/metabolite transporter (DMT)-like permease
MFQTMLWGALSCASVMTGAAGTSSVLAYTMPFWVMVLAWPILGERLAGWQWLAVVLAAIGLLLVIAPWSSESTLLSSLFATAAGMSWAVAAIIAKKMRARIAIDLWSMNAWNTLFGTIILAGLALVFPGKPTEWTGDYLFTVLYNGFGPMTLCWFFWLYALDRLVAPVAGLATLFTPVVAITCGWLLLGESPDRSELLGMVFIVAALAQLSWLGWHRERQRQRMI